MHTQGLAQALAFGTTPVLSPSKRNLRRTARQASVTAPTTTVVSPRATTTVLLFFCLSLVLDIRRRYLTLSSASFLELPAPVT
jgi:hypothetical protein